MNTHRKPLMACLLAAAAALMACGNGQRQQARQLLEQARFAQAHGRYDETLRLVDSLRRTCPKAIDERRQALKLHQEASLKQAQELIIHYEAELQQAEREYQRMQELVRTDYRPEYHQADGQSLTMLRQRRDSLQLLYDTQAAKIRYIHRRQKQ